MDVVNARCAGLDVHKATVVAGVRVPGPQPGARRGETKTFATTTRGLRDLTNWLPTNGVAAVAMESTGVYWRPVYEALESIVQLVVVNARHVKMVPGRKTDVKDCEWLAQLLECGLLRGSFVPPRAVRDLRDLTRLRKALIRERGHHVNRIAKTLELAHLKLSCVVTDLMGKTGRAILHALSAGIDDPERLAERAQGSLRKKQAAPREALVGRFTPHYAFLLPQQLSPIHCLVAHISPPDIRIDAAMAPFSPPAGLCSSPRLPPTTSGRATSSAATPHAFAVTTSAASNSSATTSYSWRRRPEAGGEFHRKRPPGLQTSSAPADARSRGQLERPATPAAPSRNACDSGSLPSPGTPFAFSRCCFL